jgi:hypothetical protein
MSSAIVVGLDEFCVTFKSPKEGEFSNIEKQKK